MNCKLATIASNPGQYSASCRVVLVISRLDPLSIELVTASARGHILRHMPRPALGLSLDNYAHAQTVDTRPFLFRAVGPGYEARLDPALPRFTSILRGVRSSQGRGHFNVVFAEFEVQNPRSRVTV